MADKKTGSKKNALPANGQKTATKWNFKKCWFNKIKEQKNWERKEKKKMSDRYI